MHSFAANGPHPAASFSLSSELFVCDCGSQSSLSSNIFLNRKWWLVVPVDIFLCLISPLTHQFYFNFWCRLFFPPTTSPTLSNPSFSSFLRLSAEGHHVQCPHPRTHSWDFHCRFVYYVPSFPTLNFHVTCVRNLDFLCVPNLCFSISILIPHSYCTYTSCSSGSCPAAWIMFPLSSFRLFPSRRQQDWLGSCGRYSLWLIHHMLIHLIRHLGPYFDFVYHRRPWVYEIRRSRCVLECHTDHWCVERRSPFVCPIYRFALDSCFSRIIYVRRRDSLYSLSINLDGKRFHFELDMQVG